jgi:hypothetical protein
VTIVHSDKIGYRILGIAGNDRFRTEVNRNMAKPELCLTLKDTLSNTLSRSIPRSGHFNLVHTGQGVQSIRSGGEVNEPVIVGNSIPVVQPVSSQFTDRSILGLI